MFKLRFKIFETLYGYWARTTAAVVTVTPGEGQVVSISWPVSIDYKNTCSHYCLTAFAITVAILENYFRTEVQYKYE